MKIQSNYWHDMHYAHDLALGEVQNLEPIVKLVRRATPLPHLAGPPYLRRLRGHACPIV